MKSTVNMIIFGPVTFFCQTEKNEMGVNLIKHHPSKNIHNISNIEMRHLIMNQTT